MRDASQVLMGFTGRVTEKKEERERERLLRTLYFLLLTVRIRIKRQVQCHAIYVAITVTCKAAFNQKLCSVRGKKKRT